jgi:hypothetical protein
MPDIRKVVDTLKNKSSYKSSATRKLADRVETGTHVYYFPSKKSYWRIPGRVIEVNPPDGYHGTSFDIELSDGRVFKSVSPASFKQRQSSFMLKEDADRLFRS